ncbi:MAG: SUMF1/EgtB/PvdO family nonheme iron enzyme [Treponema sp.]|nr:SUMF1/EgtB/PvdO family nonheme iron enzyme [Treponema sp.]
MENWWIDDKKCPCTGDAVCKCTGDSNCKCNEKSGANFAVVYLDSNGGNPQPYPFRVLYGNKVPRVRAVSHLNVTLGFGGWRDESGNVWDMDNRSVKEQDDVDGDGIITLTAEWKQNFVTVKFDTNYIDIFPSGSFPKNQKGSVITVEDQKIVPGNKIIEPPVLPTDGIHGLIGWFTKDGSPVANLSEHNSINMNDKWDFENDILNGPVNGVITLYARWSTYTRTVHLQVNGGTRPNGQELTRVNFTIFAGLGGASGGKIIDPGPLVRDGHTFAGWYTEAGVLWDFTTSRLNEVDDLEGSFLKNDAFILHARWVANIYYVTFDAKSGTPAPAMQLVAHGERVTMPPPITLDADHSFDGWFNDTDTLWNFDKDVVTRSMTLTAHWGDKAYTVVFHLGTPGDFTINTIFINAKPKDQLVKNGGAVTEPFMPSLPAGTSGWSFIGWYASNNNDAAPNTINSQNTSVRDTLLSSQSWDFTVTLNNTNTSTSSASFGAGVLNLYARWAPPAPDMIWVPRGSFIIGDSGVSGSPAAYHSYPARRVTLDGFYISRYEITQVSRQDTNKSYFDVMGVNPSQFYRNDVRPVDRISWYDAVMYCNKLTDLMMDDDDNLATPSSNRVYTISGETYSANLAGTGGVRPAVQSITSAAVTADWLKRGYRLPTEAEWEYAARGGNNTPGNFTYSGSNDATVVAWYNDTIKTGADAGSTQTVGTKAPNALGIYDMSGNITEWVWDWFASYKSEYYFIDHASSKPVSPAALSILNPRGPSDTQAAAFNNPPQRVRRGGGWSNAISNVRSVVRNSQVPGEATWVNGFRVVRGPSQIW